MGDLKQFDRELISAYLDEVLTGSQRDVAEQLLATDADAADYLGQLRTNRQALRALASDVRKLPLDFASRVLAKINTSETGAGEIRTSEFDAAQLPAAHARFEECLNDAVSECTSASSVSSSMNSSVASSVESLVRNSAEASATGALAEDEPKAFGQFSRILIRGLVALAATVLIGFGIRNYYPVGESTDGNENLAHSTLIPSASADVVPENSALAENSALVENSALLNHNAVSENNAVTENNAVVENNNVVADGSRQPTMPVMEGSGSLKALNEDLQPKITFHMLMVIDTVVSSSAWENERFETLLDECGIPIASPIISSEELSRSLMDTRMLVAEDEGDSDNNDRAAFVFLQAKASTIDRLINGMASDSDNFPDVAIDISYDMDDQMLSKILSAQSHRAGTGTAARILITDEDGLNSQKLMPNFVAGPRRQKVVRQVTRIPAGDDSSQLSSGMNPVSEVLVILRQSPSK